MKSLIVSPRKCLQLAALACSFKPSVLLVKAAACNIPSTISGSLQVRSKASSISCFTSHLKNLGNKTLPTRIGTTNGRCSGRVPTLYAKYSRPAVQSASTPRCSNVLMVRRCDRCAVEWYDIWAIMSATPRLAALENRDPALAKRPMWASAPPKFAVATRNPFSNFENSYLGALGATSTGGRSITVWSRVTFLYGFVFSSPPM
mmetsp:Transcript_32334/g.77573  ORF Transcript_32334/g.77573 Transcript_32334/m.77573 type:complete len:203 (-) Transcript_32334:213-821(-)